MAETCLCGHERGSHRHGARDVLGGKRTDCTRCSCSRFMKTPIRPRAHSVFRTLRSVKVKRDLSVLRHHLDIPFSHNRSR